MNYARPDACTSLRVVYECTDARMSSTNENVKILAYKAGYTALPSDRVSCANRARCNNNDALSRNRKNWYIDCRCMSLWPVEKGYFQFSLTKTSYRSGSETSYERGERKKNKYEMRYITQWILAAPPWRARCVYAPISASSLTTIASARANRDRQLSTHPDVRLHCCSTASRSLIERSRATREGSYILCWYLHKSKPYGQKDGNADTYKHHGVTRISNVARVETKSPLRLERTRTRRTNHINTIGSPESSLVQLFRAGGHLYTRIPYAHTHGGQYNPKLKHSKHAIDSELRQRQHSHSGAHPRGPLQQSPPSKSSTDRKLSRRASSHTRAVQSRPTHKQYIYRVAYYL
ncbi:unnamed protein product [Trichogramma brassicae]|uniref:Uncharacterized protein n=1 Tax=Trichogramma brassicae TaxID=86971 RepID=A0A6H5IL40_9HYME|nr:unnamed protein product [Trichogramma brassicae]